MPVWCVRTSRHKGQVEKAYLGDEDSVDIRVMLEGVQDPGALHVANLSIDEGLLQL